MNNASLLIGKMVHAVDGEIGSVEDVYFDDQTWNVRYFVVDASKSLPGRKVLVAPEAIVKPWHHEPSIGVELTAEQIRSSPDIDTATPVTRVAEELLYRHYQWTPYWTSTTEPILPRAQSGSALAVESLVDVMPRSANELSGYHVQAGDEEVGHVEDLLVDDDLSRILFLVVGLKGWLFEKKVLAGPSLISRVDWPTSTVHVGANRQALKSAQEYKPA
jgi:sporulation protein YlmC with PRC-barrel domain